MHAKRVRVAEGSCWPCKDRRILCDLNKPVCSKCAKAGLECAFGKMRLRWEHSLASRGRSPSVPSQQLSPLDPAGQWQVSYFQGEILPRFSMTDGCRPDEHWVVGDPVLHQAVVAISNAHRLLQHHTTTDSRVRETTEARIVAIKSFREQLQAGAVTPSPDQAFLVNVLLCMLDGMIEPSVDGSAAMHHLQGGMAILDHFPAPKAAIVERRGIKPLLHSVFGTMDLTAAILRGHAPHFDQSWWESFSGRETWWNGLQDDRDLMTVMGAMSRLASLGHRACSAHTTAPIEELLELQLLLEQTTKSTPSPTSEWAESEGELLDAIFVTAYRSSAKIYMYRALCSLPSSHTLVTRSLEEGLNALAETPRLGKLAHCLIFPELVIGSHCSQLYQQRLVLQAIESSSSYLCFGSNATLIDFLKARWADGTPETDWWTLYRPIADKGFFF